MKIQFADSVRIPAERIAADTNGVCLPKDTDISVSGLCTDSREAAPNTAFIALRGERTDGHAYISTAIESGCPCVICERGASIPAIAGVAFIRVDDTREALSKLAGAHLKKLALPTVAVTGSVGKTTTKDLIAAVLSVHARTYASSGNHNSVIGMPLSAMEVSKDDEIAVFEMGMSAFGEIEQMSLCATPDIAVITNIGTSHMEMLGSRENIARAKLEILCGLKKGGTLLINADEPLLSRVHGKSYHSLYVSTEGNRADFSAQNIRVERDRTVFDLTWQENTYQNIILPLSGRHNVYAALYAFAVGTLCGMGEGEIRAGLLSYRPAALRQNIYPLSDITVYEDCYNASPESMKAALATLSSVAAGRRIAVLGDMLELGRTTRQLHREVGAYLVSCGIDALIAVGALGAEIAEGARISGMDPESILISPLRDDIPAITNALMSRLQMGDTVLFKASRSVGLERVIAELKNKYHGAT